MRLTRLMLLLSSAMILALCFGSIVLAEPRTSTSLDIEIIPDKAVYAVNEVAILTVNVKNTSSMVAKNITLENILPSGLMYAGANPTAMFTHSQLLPNESFTQVFRVKLADNDAPITGDGFNTWTWFFVLIGLSIAFVGLCIFVRKRHNVSAKSIIVD